MLEQKFNHEQAPIKLGATFSEKSKVEQAMGHIMHKTDVDFSQIEIISPTEDDHVLGQKIEPEQEAIGKSLLRMHFWFCVYGGITGFILSLILYALGLPFINANAGVVALVFSSVGALSGLMVANIWAIKPYRDLFIDQMREAKLKRQWSLIVHVSNRLQMKKAKFVLKNYTNNVTVTI